MAPPTEYSRQVSSPAPMEHCRDDGISFPTVGSAGIAPDQRLDQLLKDHHRVSSSQSRQAQPPSSFGSAT
eukprot:5910200-Karenia_brevis.AAC.1